MLGTIVNTSTIIVGSIIGATVREGISDRYKKAMFNALGLACLVLGANASLPNMTRSEYPVMFILSLVIGGIIGTKLDLSGKIDRLNTRIGKKNNTEHNGIHGLVVGLLLFCIGSFSIIGPVLSYLSDSHGWAFNESGNTFLYTNATLDLITSAVLAASYGWIMLLAAPVLFCWQSLFYLTAYMFGDGMPEPMRVELNIIGGILIISSGLSILDIRDCKTVNLLPSLLIPIVFYIVKGLII